MRFWKEVKSRLVVVGKHRAYEDKTSAPSSHSGVIIDIGAGILLAEARIRSSIASYRHKQRWPLFVTDWITIVVVQRLQIVLWMQGYKEMPQAMCFRTTSRQSDCSRQLSARGIAVRTY